MSNWILLELLSKRALYYIGLLLLQLHLQHWVIVVTAVIRQIIMGCIWIVILL